MRETSGITSASQLAILKCYLREWHTMSEFTVIFEGQRRRLQVHGGVIPPSVFDMVNVWLPGLLKQISLKFPTDWNKVDVARLYNGPSFLCAATRIRGMGELWFPNIVDLREFTHIIVLSKDMIEATYTRALSKLHDQTDTNSSALTTTNSRRVIIKFAWDDTHMSKIQHEAGIYKIVTERAPHLAPRFLGYVRERSTVTGFMIEKIEDARHPTSAEEIGVCNSMLAQFHSYGLVHRNPLPSHFLVQNNGTDMVVKLISFGCSKEHHDDVDCMTLDFVLFQDHVEKDRSNRHLAGRFNLAEFMSPLNSYFPLHDRG